MLARTGNDLDGSSIAENFGHAWSKLGSIVMYAHNSVRSDLFGMLDHQVVCVGSGPLAKRCVDRDVAAKEHLECCADVSYRATRADNDPPDEAQGLGDASPRNFPNGDDEIMVHRISSRC
jgi:hypothetical protein